MAIQIDFALRTFDKIGFHDAKIKRNLGWKPMDAEFASAIKMHNYFVRVL